MKKFFPLDKLNLKQAAIIEHLDDSIQERMTSIGVFPGIEITPLYKSPLGDPIAYSVLDTIFAIRKKDASKIFVRIKR